MPPIAFHSLLFYLLAVAQAGHRDEIWDQDTSMDTQELKDKVSGQEGFEDNVNKLGFRDLSASNEDNNQGKKKGGVDKVGVSDLFASNEDNVPGKLEVSDLLASDEANKSDDDSKKLKKTRLTLTKNQIKKLNIWPEAKIPFYIDEFSYDKVLRDKIRSHLDDASALSGVLDFEELPGAPEDDNKRWVLFVNRRGQLDCVDYSPKSFTNSGVQKVIIGYDCLNNRGDMAATVLALAGVPPQHNAPNRDKFITVNEDSILPDKKQLFKRLSDDEWLFGPAYDFQSAGHYHSLKYTANGQPTIGKKPVGRVGQAERGEIREQNNYSAMDIEKIRDLYYNIMRNNPKSGIQKEHCDTLYESGNAFKKLKDYDTI